jgi:CubicO group peptidase (beta-lactamase class C family)/acetyl esterase/lipase
MKWLISLFLIACSFVSAGVHANNLDPCSFMTKIEKGKPFPIIIKEKVPEYLKYESAVIFTPCPDTKERDLDILYHADHKTVKRPAIVILHGGGWKSGDSTRGHEIMAIYATQGYVTISINYRLSGTAIAPAAVHDCKLAIRWTRANAEKYGIDPKRIGCTGGSAGGHLTAMMAVTEPSDGVEGPHLEDYSSAVQAAMPLSGVYDFRFSEPRFFDPFLGGKLGARKEGLTEQMSPTLLLRPEKAKTIPPMLIVHSDNEMVHVKQFEEFIAALEKIGRKEETILLPGKGHGHKLIRVPEVREAADKFFRKHLNPQLPVVAEKPEDEKLHVVLLADEKDHGPAGNGLHDYPLWQKRWALLLGEEEASEEKQVNRVGPPEKNKDDYKGMPHVQVTCAWHWPSEEQFQTADAIAAYCYLEWTDERLAQVRRYLEGGGGLVLIHSATWTRPKTMRGGVAEVIGVGGFKLFRHGMVQMEVLASEHPICAGLPETIILEDDETYWPPTPIMESVTVLATAVEDKAKRGSTPRAAQPMFWCYELGEGRVFGCVPGHSVKTFDDPVFRKLLFRGIAWTAGENPFGAGAYGAQEESAEEAKMPTATDLHSHGVTQDQIESLAEILRQAVQQELIAGGSFLVAHKGEIVFRKAFGYADLESKRLFTTDELLPIASVSKPFMASVLMVLVEQGKVKLDDPVAKCLPEFKGVRVEGGKSPARPMTVRHLLSHTAGFWGNKGITPEKRDLIRNFKRPLAEAVELIAEYDLLYEPGTKWIYSGTGYCVAGRVAEVTLGQSLEEIAQDALFRPLGLNRTTFLPSKEVRKTVPTAYLRKGGKLQRQRSMAEIDLRFILPGGSLFTTLDELAVFGQMHLNDGVYNGKRILSEASVTEMRRLQSPDRPQRTCGLGWFRGDVSESGLADLVFHGGALGAHFRIDRRREVVCVFLVHQTAVQVQDLKNKLVEQVNEMFPVPKGR